MNGKHLSCSSSHKYEISIEETKENNHKIIKKENWILHKWMPNTSDTVPLISMIES